MKFEFVRCEDCKCAYMFRTVEEKPSYCRLCNYAPTESDWYREVMTFNSHYE